jgi:hypothetical protein
MRDNVSLPQPRSGSAASVAVDTLVAPENLALSNPSVSESMRRKPGGSILFISVVFLLVGFFAWRNLSTWPAIINYPDDESYEGVVLATMIHLRQGVPIYAPGATGHFDGATYGPLYYLLGERLVNPQSPSYLPLRLLSAFAILGCAVCCGLLAFWLTGRPLAGWLSWFVFVSYGMVTGHGLLALSDSVALLLAFSGFLVAYRWRNSGAVLFAAPLMVLSFYYKPQYIAGSLAVLLYLALEKRYRQALEFAGLLAFCGLGLFALFQWVVFSGQAFWRHFLLYQSSSLALHLVVGALLGFSILLLLPVISLFEYFRRYPDKLIGCYLCVAIILGLLTFCKSGSGAHYFFESVFLLCALVPAFLVTRLGSQVYPIDLVLILAIMLVAGQRFEPRAPQPADVAKYKAMQSFLVRNFPPGSRSLGPHPGGLLQGGLEAPFSGLFELAVFAHRGLVSDQDLIAEIQGRRFAVVVSHFDISQERDPYWLRFYATPAILRAIDTDYQIDTSLDMPATLKQRPQDRFYVYVPRPRVAASTSSGEKR